MNKKTHKAKKIEAIVDGIEKGTNKYSAKEKNMPRDVARIEKNIGGMNRGPLAEIWDNVTALWESVKDPDVPVVPKLVIIGALIYVISPIDLVPDFIPGAGLLDDVAVIMLIFGLMSDLINKVKNKVVEAATEVVAEVKNKAVEAATEVAAEVKNKAVEAVAETAAIQTRAHLHRLRISLIVSIVVATLAIIVALTIRLINTV